MPCLGFVDKGTQRRHKAYYMIPEVSTFDFLWILDSKMEVERVSKEPDNYELSP